MCDIVPPQTQPPAHADPNCFIAAYHAASISSRLFPQCSASASLSPAVTLLCCARMAPPSVPPPTPTIEPLHQSQKLPTIFPAHAKSPMFTPMPNACPNRRLPPPPIRLSSLPFLYRRHRSRPLTTPRHANHTTHLAMTRALMISITAQKVLHACATLRIVFAGRMSRRAFPECSTDTFLHPRDGAVIGRGSLFRRAQ